MCAIDPYRNAHKINTYCPVIFKEPKALCKFADCLSIEECRLVSIAIACCRSIRILGLQKYAQWYRFMHTFFTTSNLESQQFSTRKIREKNIKNAGINAFDPFQIELKPISKYENHEFPQFAMAYYVYCKVKTEFGGYFLYMLGLA